MEERNVEARTVTVSGRVQGVFFRAAAKHFAESRGIRGYAKNLSDGSVECFIEGAPESIEAFIRWTRKGPPFSVVKNVAVEKVKPRGYSQFAIEG